MIRFIPKDLSDDNPSHTSHQSQACPSDLSIAEKVTVSESLSSSFAPSQMRHNMPDIMRLEIDKTNCPPAMQYKSKDDINSQPSIRTKSVFPWESRNKMQKRCQTTRVSLRTFLSHA